MADDRSSTLDRADEIERESATLNRADELKDLMHPAK